MNEHNEHLFYIMLISARQASRIVEELVVAEEPTIDTMKSSIRI